MGNVNQARLLSHALTTVASDDQFIHQIADRIKREGDKPHVSVEQQLALLEQLSQLEFGRFLLQNQGINGYWTHYMLTYPWVHQKPEGQIINPYGDIENFMLTAAPTMLATQQRFRIFLEQNQLQVREDAKLACVPCGVMSELLYLDYQGISTIELVGIDYDVGALSEAKKLADEKKLSSFLTLEQGDAWHLGIENAFDLISSNGLNIYEPDPEKVKGLFAEFYAALKPGGKLVTSFLTPPPGMTEVCEWDMRKINQQHALFQQIIFADIIQLKCRYFQSSREVASQLESIGYRDITFFYDEARLFPTVVAFK
ncbi:MAG TPA: class I SAM-dependent methyltransferase [Gammaproteobacteria bacterium]|jgi:SAM-dependent methyltransferase|nr:class I SAM-dependent methyltransferase [Gammaproteobacteria bacterium]